MPDDKKPAPQVFTDRTAALVAKAGDKRNLYHCAEGDLYVLATTEHQALLAVARQHLKCTRMSSRDIQAAIGEAFAALAQKKEVSDDA